MSRLPFLRSRFLWVIFIFCLMTLTAFLSIVVVMSQYHVREVVVARAQTLQTLYHVVGIVGAFMALGLLFIWVSLFRPMERLIEEKTTALLAKIDLHQKAENDLRRMNDEQRRISHALSESEARYRSLVQHLSSGIVLYDAEGAILTCNQSAERILGVTINQMSGRTALDPMWRVIYENGSPFPGDLHPAMQVLKTGKAINHVVMGIYKPDSSLTWILMNAQPVFLPDIPNPIEVVVSFTDITQVKLAAVQMLAIEIERERAKVLTDFISNTSHELRTPLTIINSSAYLIQKIREPDKIQQKLIQIFEQVNYLDRMITQLQEMSRLNQPRDLTLIMIKPCGLLERFIAHYPLNRREVELKMKPCSDKEGYILGNMEYLMLALGYLVDNAVRYSPDGEVIWMYAEHDKNEERIYVEDHGQGIPPEHVGRVFEPFYKVDAARTQNDSATGMGLTMVRRIMELHDGQVSIISHRENNTVFRLTFPHRESLTKSR